MGGTLALALPLTFFELSLTLHLGLVGMTSGAFWLMAQLWPHRLTDHHASDSRAVWFLAEERLCCRNAQWAADLLATEPSATVVASPDHDPDGELASALRRERVRGLLGAALGIAALLGIAVASHNFFYPLVRVVNLTDEQLEVRVDGRWIATVPPSTVESPTAGAELFPPAGRHRWTATNRRGQVISDVNGVVTAGAEHLYAPGEHDKCFWVETVHYGRGADPDNAIERLPPGLGFWRLPSGVDAWFVPNPPNRSSSLATTGGKLTAMRQARCSVAP